MLNWKKNITWSRLGYFEKDLFNNNNWSNILRIIQGGSRNDKMKKVRSKTKKTRCQS